jgi:pimeloyl-ACP methyl ester carboxylesterase
MQKGEVQETDYPALARLEMCEALLIENRTLGEVIDPLARKSDVWMSLAKSRSSVAVRLRAPAENKGPMPVLFLFHGAGGSENMFFETYGAGRVVDEGLKRGWLVVAPRQGLFGLSLDVEEMLDVLDQSFEIDRSQVMLIGHSMGAGQVVRQTALHPELPIVAVALGGGNRVADAAELKPIAWFVGAGSEDFGKGGAKQLHKSLESAGVSSSYHEYPNVEHMVIVQAAIDDVFQFLDRTGNQKQ